MQLLKPIFILALILMPSLGFTQTVAPTPWTQQGYTTLSVTTSSTSTALPGNLSAGSIVNVCNTGSNDAFVAIGNSSVTATTNNVRVPNSGGCVPLPAPAFSTSSI